MFRMYTSNSHSYTHLILTLGIVRKPTVWVFIASKYPGTHDIGLLMPDIAMPQHAPPRIIKALCRAEKHACYRPVVLRWM